LTPEEVRALITQGEGQRLEFKRSLALWKSYSTGLAELETGTRAAVAMAKVEGDDDGRGVAAAHRGG